MVRLHDVARPAAMISQTWPTSRETEGATLGAIEAAMANGFFTALQTVEVPFPDERKQIAGAIGDRPLTYCVSRVLNENKLNLSSLDASIREASSAKVIACFDDAREAGASGVSFISGARPDEPGKREDALAALQESLAPICEAAAQGPALRVLIEPLDTDAHKENTLGTTREALALCGALQRKGLGLRLCLDTAHMVLNGESPIEELPAAIAFTDEFHFCNCVTDQGHELFGDRHIAFGEPGWLTVQEMGRLMHGLVDTGFLNEQKKPVLLCEVLKTEAVTSEDLLAAAEKALCDAWEMANE